MIADIFKRFMLSLIWVYQVFISPLTSMLGAKCRHSPSCSSYSKEAITRHGSWIGGWMTLARVCRCHPFGSDGVDNVPETATTPSKWTPWKYGVWRLIQSNEQQETKDDDHDHIS